MQKYGRTKLSNSDLSTFNKLVKDRKSTDYSTEINNKLKNPFLKFMRSNFSQIKSEELEFYTVLRSLKDKAAKHYHVTTDDNGENYSDDEENEENGQDDEEFEEAGDYSEGSMRSNEVSRRNTGKLKSDTSDRKLQRNQSSARQSEARRNQEVSGSEAASRKDASQRNLGNEDQGGATDSENNKELDKDWVGEYIDGLEKAPPGQTNLEPTEPMDKKPSNSQSQKSGNKVKTPNESTKNIDTNPEPNPDNLDSQQIKLEDLPLPEPEEPLVENIKIERSKDSDDD